MNPIVERVDLVDSSGQVAVKAVPRTDSDSYPHLHLQIVIGVIFDKDGNILVHKRPNKKS